MTHRFGRTIIIALGGSVIYPESIDTDLIKEYRFFVRRLVAQGKRIILVVGGGRLSRTYQAAAHKITRVTDEDKDWLGIHATRLNAQLLRTVFRDIADPVVFDHARKFKRLRYPVTIASGWRPGWSTDYIAVALACDFKVPEVVIAGKPSHVYPHTERELASKRRGNKDSRSVVGDFDKDRGPELDMNRPHDVLTWKEYRRLIPKEWHPGFSSPVDPVAARLAERRKKTAIVVSGKDLKNFERLLQGKSFSGTIIE
jgi:uridylate kinase